jgi:replicative DNA helicase
MSNLILDNDFYELVIAYNVLTNETYLTSIIDKLSPTFFKNQDVKLIIDIITKFYQTNSSLPTPTEIKSYLINQQQKDSFKNVVQSFKSLDTKFNQEELFRNTEKFIKEKSMYDIIVKTVDEFAKNKIDINKTMEEVEKACGITLIDNLGHNYFKQIDKHCNELQDIYKYISTGWKWLDDKLGGGFLESGKALYVYTGFTNVGKSLFLGNNTVNVLKQNKCVVLISLEMSELVYSRRFTAQLTKIKNNEIPNSISQIRECINKYTTEHPGAQLIVKEFPPKSITVNHIKAYLKKLKANGVKPDLIVIDYINLLLPTVISNSSYENVKMITEQLRALSYYTGCSILTASQINRSGAGVSNPGMETISESIGLSFTADAQFGIWQNDSDRELGIIHLGIQKNRFGPAFGTTSLKINYDNFLIDETSDLFTSSEALKDTTNSLDKFLLDNKNSG